MNSFVIRNVIAAADFSPFQKMRPSTKSVLFMQMKSHAFTGLAQVILRVSLTVISQLLSTPSATPTGRVDNLRSAPDYQKADDRLERE